MIEHYVLVKGFNNDRSVIHGPFASEIEAQMMRTVLGGGVVIEGAYKSKQRGMYMTPEKAQQFTSAMAVIEQTFKAQGIEVPEGGLLANPGALAEGVQKLAQNAKPLSERLNTGKTPSVTKQTPLMDETKPEAKTSG